MSGHVVKKNELKVIQVKLAERIIFREKAAPGSPGPPGEQGPPGGFEIVAITIDVAGVWKSVPLTLITYVVDVIVYDQVNREKVEIDTRINANQTVEVRSSLLKTYTVHILGY
jgi:hypothetical protein